MSSMAAQTSAAPGRLEVVRRFVNTRDIEAGTDSIGTPADLRGWLLDNDLLDPGPRPSEPSADLAGVQALREALRTALAANHDRTELPADAVATVNSAADRAALSLRLTGAGAWTATPLATGIDGAIGELLAVVSAAMADRTWRRLKVCVNDDCRWAFYDHSRARSGRWCSMQVCGNRAKQQAWRRRTAGSGS